MSNLDHSSRKHALLSASGASRWLNCTPSARLEEKFQQSQSSIYAQEGTLAHEFGDVILRYINGEIEEKTLNTELNKLRREELYSDEMEEQVDKYVEFVKDSFDEAYKTDKGAAMLIEERLDFSHLVEQGFGTGDATVIGNGILDIIDLKYGKGVKVSAQNNPQLKLYASGALNEYDMLYDIHTVRMTIVQPRLDHIDTYEMSVEDLEMWGNKVVKPAAEKAYAGKGKQQAGDWCKWCKVKAMCATLAAKNVKLAQHEFRDPHLLSEKQLVEVYKQQPMLVDWVNAVSKYLLEQALNGKRWPGYKVVEGRSNRKFINNESVALILDKEGYSESEYMVKKLGGITHISKLLGKEFNTLLSPYVIKPPGAPTLVPESDKRPELNSIEQAKEEFKN